MANNKIPVIIHITPDYYNDKGHFWARLNLIKRMHNGHQDKIILLVSYKYFKPTITSKQVSHYNEALRVFPNIAVIHAEGVNWRGHDAELVAMDVPIYPQGYTGNL